MYCGDEISAVIADIGSATSKFGYAGEDTPRHVFNSFVGIVEGDKAEDENGSADTNPTKRIRLDTGDKNTPGAKAADKAATDRNRYCISKSVLDQPRAGKFLKPVHTPEGYVKDWDLLEKLWDFAFGKNNLFAKPEEYPTLVCEQVFTPHKDRLKLTELLFEKYKMPAIFLANNAVMSCFSAGRSTGISLSSGYSCTTVCPIRDGYVLQKASRVSPVSGRHLTQALLKRMLAKGVEVRPRCCFKQQRNPNGGFDILPIKTPHLTESFLNYRQLEIAREAKESLCTLQAHMPTKNSKAKSAATPTPVSTDFYLPDRTKVDLSGDVHEVPELLLNCGSKESAGTETTKMADKDLTSLIHDSITSCDPDLRKEVLNHIVLTGGSTLIRGLPQRLSKDLSAKLPSAFNPRFITPGSVERHFGCWIGGSVLASLGSFQQLWLSKVEFEEMGPSLLQRRCPS